MLGPAVGTKDAPPPRLISSPTALAISGGHSSAISSASRSPPRVAHAMSGSGGSRLSIVAWSMSGRAASAKRGGEDCALAGGFEIGTALGEIIDAKLYARIPYLPAGSQLADDYLADLQVVLDFARESRKEMLIRVLEVLAAALPGVMGLSSQELMGGAYDIAHNLVREEEHFGEKLFVHRKGATCLAKGQVGMIPGSMGTCSYIVEGRGNPFGFNSCSHGAGRTMSRGDAFRTISDKEFSNSLAGVIHEHDTRIKDEAPAAYKDIRRVMAHKRIL